MTARRSSVARGERDAEAGALLVFQGEHSLRDRVDGAGQVAVALPVQSVEHFDRDRQMLGELGVVPADHPVFDADPDVNAGHGDHSYASGPLTVDPRATESLDDYRSRVLADAEQSSKIIALTGPHSVAQPWCYDPACSRCSDRGARCSFSGCIRAATQHMVLSQDGLVIIDRPICLQHLKHELPVREGYKLTITSTSPSAIPPG